jgi:hypothetical protein
VVDSDSGKLRKSLTSATVFNLYGSNHRVNYTAIQDLLGELSELGRRFLYLARARGRLTSIKCNG